MGKMISQLGKKYYDNYNKKNTIRNKLEGKKYN